MDKTLQMYIDKLNALNFKEMYNGDFFLTWEKTDDEITWKSDLVTCAALYVAAVNMYDETKKVDVYEFRAGKTNNDIL